MFIRKAERRQAKLRLALCGVSGSGKTLGAIRIAKGMGKRFVVIDTEDTSADLYSDVANYDVLTLQAPFSPARYIEAIKMCEEEGYETIIIDSLSHAWAGTGGILDIQDGITKASSSKNSYTSWREVTPMHNKLIDAILHSSAHIIVCMRSKVHYDLLEHNGKKVPVKVGLAPIQREGLDYEFTVVLDIDQKSHLYSASKDRTRLFDGKHETISDKTGSDLIEWLSQGVDFEKETESALKLHLEMIKESLTLEDLKSSFEDACKDNYLKGTDKIRLIIDAKDQRKLDLAMVKAQSNATNNQVAH